MANPHGYYVNVLRQWRRESALAHKRLVSQIERMGNRDAPKRAAIVRLMNVQVEMLEIIDRKISAAEILERNN